VNKCVVDEIFAHMTETRKIVRIMKQMISGARLVKNTEMENVAITDVVMCGRRLQMTNKEAADILRLMPKQSEAIKKAIEVLEQESCEDAISREAALKEAYAIVVDGEKYDVVQVETIYGLPSVTRQTGEWIEEKINDYSYKVYCSSCREHAIMEYVSTGDMYSASGHGEIKKTKYCPNCGAKMFEPQESEDKE